MREKKGRKRKRSDGQKVKDDDAVIVQNRSTATASASTAYDLRSFDDSGLPNHLLGSWNNAKTILELHGVGEFPGNDSKRAVISLTSGICHTVSCSKPLNKPISCHDQCPKFNSERICAHTIAAAFYNGCLESYLCSYTPSLSTLVRSSIRSHTGRKNNEKKQRKRKTNDLRDLPGVRASANQDYGAEEKKRMTWR